MKIGISGICVPLVLALIYFSFGHLTSRASAEDLEKVKITCDHRELAVAAALRDLTSKIEDSKYERREFEIRMDMAMAYLVPGYKGAKNE